MSSTDGKDNEPLLPQTTSHEYYDSVNAGGSVIEAVALADVEGVGQGSAAANSVVFGEYVVHFLGGTPNQYNTRLVAFLCLTFCLLAHGTMHKFGLQL
ncbi:hypothetical protein H0H93_014949 [Arthromyces matolae]|nr:hypothetical protein H0H93_014949 [Arthromyces matolae]